MADHSETESNTAREEVMRMFLANQDIVSAFLYSLVEDWDLVEDAIQETTVYLCSHWNDYTPGTNFGAWIRTIARMRCQKALRQKRRSGILRAPEFQTAMSSATQEEWDHYGTSTPARTRMLNHCLNSLPESHRRIIEMHYQEETSCEQIAASLDKSVESLYMTLSRIRKRLRVCLERRMAEESA